MSCFRRLIIGLLIIQSSTLGCVRRRLTIRSNPPGALVYIDNQEIGRTPVATPFTYYGTREFRLLKEGFQTITVKQAIPPPWYQIPPLDFFSENLNPQQLRDERVVEFELVPERNVSVNDVLGQADQLRNAARSSGTTNGSRIQLPGFELPKRPLPPASPHGTPWSLPSSP